MTKKHTISQALGLRPIEEIFPDYDFGIPDDAVLAGGYGSGFPHTEESRKALSDYWKGRKRAPFSDEHRRNISLSQRGMKRKPLSNEHKMKISKSNKGRVLSEEEKAACRIAGLGYKHTDEARQKISAAAKGRTPPPISDETRNKLKKARANQIFSKDTIAKRNESNRGKKRPTIECPKCGSVGGVAQMARWHFENCKRVVK